MLETTSTTIQPLRPRGDRGASLVEYALLIALVAITCFVAVAFFGDSTSDTFSRVGSSVEATPPD